MRLTQCPRRESNSHAVYRRGILSLEQAPRNQQQPAGSPSFGAPSGQSGQDACVSDAPISLPENRPEWMKLKPMPKLSPKDLARLKRDCRNHFWYGITSGEIKKEGCALASDACRGAISAHHEDYRLPFDVVWLCRKHHTEADRARRKREAGAQ